MQMISSVFWLVTYFHALQQYLGNKELVTESKAVSEARAAPLHRVGAAANGEKGMTVTSEPQAPQPWVVLGKS